MSAKALAKQLSAYNKIVAKGEAIVIKRQYTESFNAVTRQRTPGQSRKHETYAVRLPASSGRIEAFDNKSLEMTAKRQRFMKVAAYQMPFEPQEGDQIELENSEWTVAGCTPISMEGIPIIYNVGIWQ